MAARRAKPKLVRLKAPEPSIMADTLVFLLERVRTGKIKAFSICVIAENAEGAELSIETAGADGDSHREIQLLGCMRMAEHNLIARRKTRQATEE
jgi:hypothetical protein